MIKANKISNISALLCYLFILVASLGALAIALYMQHVKGLQPCTMCILQRYAFAWISFCAITGLIFPIRGVRLLASYLGIAGAIGGVFAAARNLWVMSHPDILCGRDSVEIFLNGLPTANWFPDVFVPLGLCSDPIPPLFGLALPSWSLLGLIVLACLLWFAIHGRR